jgi:acid stress-induced BolA-like protein IbaG/YrbA
MARRYRLPPVYDRLKAQLEEVVFAIVDRHDPEALVHVGMSAMGRIHIIIVSEKLARQSQADREALIWAELEGRIPKNTLELISVFQVLSVEEALRLHGPADAEMLISSGERLWRQWSRLSLPELERELSEGRLPAEVGELLSATENWARTSSILRLSVPGADLAKAVAELRKMTANGKAMDRGPALLRRLLRRLPAVIQELHEVPAEKAA